MRYEILDEAYEELRSYAQRTRSGGVFNDVTVRVGETDIPCNKLVLACYSSYFEHQIYTDKDCTEIVLKGNLSADLVAHLIEYIYGHELILTKENVLDILECADFLQIEEFSFLSLSELQYYMDRRTLQNITEESRYSAVLAWVKANRLTRTRYLPVLLENLDFGRFSNQFIQSIICSENLIRKSKRCLNLVIDEVQKWESRKEDVDFKFMVLGSAKSPNTIRSYSLNGAAEDTYLVCDAKIAVPDILCSAFVQYKGLLYKLGGQSASSHMETSTVFTMFTCHMKVSVVPVSIDSMWYRKQCASAAVLDDILYVVGGFNALLRHMNIVECYDFNLRRFWKHLPALHEGRSGHCLVALNGCLYCIGGRCDERYLASVEMYDPMLRKWFKKEPMIQPRCWFAALVKGNSIYCFGGSKDGISANRTLERYDADWDMWTLCQSMKQPRVGHAACWLNGSIVVTGGIDCDGSFVKEVETYNPTNDVWTVHGTIDSNLFLHAMFPKEDTSDAGAHQLSESSHLDNRVQLGRQSSPPSMREFEFLAKTSPGSTFLSASGDK
uniref:kelch-like protein 12 isoform X2 n=1 Tax=Ciona intestinalis TaxID=7719 RepID=UPI000EF48B33|nr:kelch-like protein 12 isoform X2 [Ciona intestinalis]|eukprot:XP_026696325.1 kelch-like protein 12 isoform X2 [Ciona intestinalis]